MARSRGVRLAEALAGTGLEVADLEHLHPYEALIIVAKAARKTGAAEALAHDRELRARRREEKRRYREDHGEGLARLGAAVGRRAGLGHLDTLEELQRFLRHGGPEALGLAVEGARSQGFSDREIGEALGSSREAVGQRFGRRGAASPDSESDVKCDLTEGDATFEIIELPHKIVGAGTGPSRTTEEENGDGPGSDAS